MAFVLTLLYIAVTLLSPGVFPQAIAALHVSEILGVLVILTGVWDLGNSNLSKLPETFLGIALLFASSISMAATGWLGGAVQHFMDFIPIVITYYFVAVTCNTLRRVKILVVVLTLVAMFIFAQGFIAQYSGNYGSLYLETEGVGTTEIFRYRGLGVISDPNDFAQLLVMLIPLLWLRWKKGATASNFFLTIIPAAILATGVFYTHSRGGALALVAVILFGFKDKVGIAGSATLAGLSVVVLTILDIGGGRGISEDDGGRVTAWATGLETLKSHPIFGVGPGNFNDYNPTGYTAHNSFILCMVELGMFGYFFWMGMIVSSWLGLSRIIKEHAPIPLPEFNPNLPRHLQFSKPGAFKPVPRLVEAPAGGPGMASRSIAKQAPMRNTPNKWAPAAAPFSGSFALEERPAPDQLAYAAKIVRISFVGLLGAGFFLSRTYAVTLYVMLGMAVSIIQMEPLPEIDVPALVKKILIVCFSSLVFLYIFIRLHGGK